MLASVIWLQYFLALLIASVIYYLSVWLVSFKAKISFSSNPNFLRSANPPGEDSPDEMLSTTQHIIDEIKPLFADRHNKNELIYALQLKLKKYQQWEEPGMREVINAFISTESESKCSILLSEEDQRALWI